MCNDVKKFVATMKEHNICCDEIQDQGWGVLTHVTLPGGGKIGVYQPRYARPKPISRGAKSIGQKTRKSKTIKRRA